jgi:glycosyltransferase involved in cell wall biosynthesis/predicted glycosyltransferase involved in capsule biosynthesis
MISTTPLLAAVMIVKNEEQHLGRCLASIKELCDEIIIVDTGSTDATISIAESFGARVFHRTWNNDFAAARNESLSHTTANWVLYIDADEMLVNADVPQLRSMLARSHEVAAFGIQVSPMIGWLPYTDFRLWRHDPAIQFVGDIHETTLPDINVLAAQRNQRLQPIALHMQHFGYEGDQTKKHLRNLPLLEQQSQHTPRKINILNQLARIHFELGNHEAAENVWRTALRVIEEDGEKEVTDVIIFASYADLLMTKSIDAEPLIAQGRQLRPDYLVLHLAAARNHLKMGRYEEAIEQAQALLAHAENPPVDSRYAYNMKMFTLWPRQILSESLFSLARYSQARFELGNTVSLGAPYEHLRPIIRECEKFIDGFTSNEAPSSSSPRELVDLSDATFLIPLRVDSGERLRNVIALCEWLTKTFDTHILIGNADPEKVRTLFPVSVDIKQIDDDSRYPFHVTRVFNTLARNVTTPVIIQCDADVFVPPYQLTLAVRQVVNNPNTVVYPFTYSNPIPTSDTTEFLSHTVTSTTRLGYPTSFGTPVGGCVVRNTEGFFASGMDNEYFIGWTSEDKERMERLTRLGYEISRIEGPLFHLEHTPVRHVRDNHQFHELGELERARLQTLSDDEFRREIQSWPWVHKSLESPASIIEAEDLTITIPVRIDSPQRLANLVVCTQALLRSTTARIIVGIHQPSDIASQLDPRVEVVQVDDPSDSLFHRTRILNDLAHMVESEFIANLDCDIVVPLMQWQYTIDLLREGKTDLAYPYDGTMIEVPYSFFPWLEQNQCTSMPKTMQVVMHPNSVGGCVVWRRKSFIASGMENQHFVSWGYEDDERLARANILGLNVERITGSVFHLHHPRGQDSSEIHPHYELNRQELQRISEMNKEELDAEVKSWLWHRESTVN